MMRWYEQNARSFPWRSWRDPYRLCVTELLLQRTTARAVANYVEAFLRRYPDPQSILAAPADQLRENLEPLGLSRRRTAALISAAEALSTGEDFSDPHGPGPGQYVRRAVAVGAHGASAAMVDANFVRILVRVVGGEWMADYRYDRRLQQLAYEVVIGHDARTVNWAVMDFGALVCKPRRPQCPTCPLRLVCSAAADAQSDDTT
jgi:A/G-specific adenine glycosylase